MIPEHSSNSVTVSGNFHTKQFGIDSEDFSHLVDLIQNQLYSNKPLALIREYSCNAYDANVIAGRKDTPIKVTLPSKIVPQIKIRDYGDGLTLEQMEGIFTRYGKSTKRGDNVQVGCFGIGSKAGFAYGQSFMVIGYTSGVKTVYNCVLDESNIGKLILIGSDVTDERDGLEIIINVRNEDIHTFRDLAMSFYKYWDVMPDIEGFTADEYNAIRGSDKIALSGNGWSIMQRDSYYHNGKSVAVMGNIGYPINWNSVNGLKEILNTKDSRGYNALYDFIVHNTIRFDFAIGEVKMSPSRESLQYTELTNKAIIKRVELMISEIAAEAQKKMDTASNLWDAKIMYNDLCSNSGILSNLGGIVKLKYNNNVIEHNDIIVTGDDKIVTKYYRPSNRANFLHHSTNTIECLPRKMILEVDQEKYVYVRKAVQYLNETKNMNTVYVLTFSDKNQRDEFFAANNLDESFVTKYSSISDAVKNTIIRKTSNGGVSLVKNDSSVRSLKYCSSAHSYRLENVNDLPSTETDLANGGIYVETYYNSIKDGSNVPSIVDKVCALGVINNSEMVVHFINQNLVGGKLMNKGNWIAFNDYITNKANEVISNNPFLYKVMAYRKLVNDNCDKYTINRAFKRFLKTHAFNNNVTELLDILNTKWDSHYNIVNDKIAVNDNDVRAIEELFVNLKKQFPLWDVFNHSMSYMDGIGDEEIVNYFKERA